MTVAGQLSEYLGLRGGEEQVTTKTSSPVNRHTPQQRKKRLRVLRKHA